MWVIFVSESAARGVVVDVGDVARVVFDSHEGVGGVVGVLDVFVER